VFYLSEEEKKVEKPKLELLETGLATIELCNPIKDQLNQIKVCKPNIVVSLCNPVDRIKCIPDIPDYGCLPMIWCRPASWCIPETWCRPKIWCRPLIAPLIALCPPQVGPCGPWVEGPCGPMVEVPSRQIDEIAARVEKLTAEIEALKKKVSK